MIQCQNPKSRPNQGLGARRTVRLEALHPINSKQDNDPDTISRPPPPALGLAPAPAAPRSTPKILRLVSLPSFSTTSDKSVAGAYATYQANLL